MILQNGSECDVVHSYFGLRSLSAEKIEESTAPASLCLNGEPIYLRGALYQSYHPEGVYTAGDVESIQTAMAGRNRVGFDFFGVHLKEDDRLVLIYANTVGFRLLWDFQILGEGGDAKIGG